MIIAQTQFPFQKRGDIYAYCRQDRSSEYEIIIAVIVDARCK